MIHPWPGQRRWRGTNPVAGHGGLIGCHCSRTFHRICPLPQIASMADRLVSTLSKKRDFVKARIDAGQRPSPQQLADFLRGLTLELGSVVKHCPPEVKGRGGCSKEAAFRFTRVFSPVAVPP